MNAKIIYEKKFPRDDFSESKVLAELTTNGTQRSPTPSFNELMESIYKNTTYILIPERIKASRDFVCSAIEISNLYSLDIVIERHTDHICVNFSFNCCGGIQGMNRIFGMADQFSFFKDIHGWDITVSLDFFTHFRIRNGKIISP